MRLLTSVELQTFLSLGAAEGTAPAAGAAGPVPSLLASPLPLLVFMGVLFYFMILRPQKKVQNQHQEMLKSLKPGDRVLTKGGVYGTVAQVKEQILVLKVSDNVKLEVSRAYVEDRVSQAEGN